jgi:hypothetical protein
MFESPGKVLNRNEKVSPTCSISLELGGMYTEVELVADGCTCVDDCGGAMVTKELGGCVGDGLDEDGTGEGEKDKLRNVLTDEKTVLLAWEAPVPEVPRGLPPGSWK